MDLALGAKETFVMMNLRSRMGSPSWCLTARTH